MKIEELIRLPNLLALANAGLPEESDLADLLSEIEPVDVRWQPWRGTVFAIVRISQGGSDIGYIAVVVGRRVSQFAYSAKTPLIAPGFRAGGTYTSSKDDGLFKVTLNIGGDEQVSFECEGALIITGNVLEESQLTEFPDYGAMDESYLSTLQPSWADEFQPTTFTAVGQWT